MSVITCFNKNEKLAMLKLMIMIRSHYSSRLPEGLEFIRKTAVFFKLPDGILDAYDLSDYDAIDILSKAFNGDVEKRNYFIGLLSFMLRSSGNSIFNEVLRIEEEAIDNDDYDFKMNLLEIEFKKEWDYVFKLIVGNIISKKDMDIFTTSLLLFWTGKSPFDSCWNYIVDGSKESLCVDSNATKTEDTDTILINHAVPKHNNQTISHKHLTEDIKQSTNKIENDNEILDLSSIKDELRKELEGFVREELTKFINTELKEFVLSEIKEGIQKEINSMMNNDFNETLYKDL